jgi:hypothetical protein
MSATVSICKECAKFFVEDGDPKKQKERLTLLLQTLDTPFDENVYVNAFDNEQETLGTYFRLIGMVQYRAKKFEDSTVFKDAQTVQEESTPEWIREKKEATMEGIDMDEMRKKYGVSVSKGEFYLLEQVFINRGGEDAITPQEIADYVELAKVAVKANKAYEDNDLSEYRQLLKEVVSWSNMIAKNHGAGGSKMNREAFGVFIQRVEDTRPVVGSYDFDKLSDHFYFDQKFRIPQIKQIFNKLSIEEQEQLAANIKEAMGGGKTPFI